MARKGKKSGKPEGGASKSGDQLFISPVAIPEELQPVWNEEIAQAFADLRPNQQTFLLAYLNTGNAAESYRQAYNPNAGDHLAGNCGAQVLESNGVQAILAKFQAQRTNDLFLVVQTLREMSKATKPQWQQDKDGQWENAGDVPDWLARKHSVDGITKLRGFNAPEIKEITGKNGAPLISTLTDEQIEARIVALAKAGIAPTP